MNALYYKGKWNTRFNRRKTRKTLFFIDNTKSLYVDMMKGSGEFRVKKIESLDAKILGLPYQNKFIRMFIILPNKKDGLVALEQNLMKLSSSEFYDFMSLRNVSLKSCTINIPKFELDIRVDIKQVLEKMGFKKLLENGSERILEKAKVGLDMILQKYYIEV